MQKAGLCGPAFHAKQRFGKSKLRLFAYLHLAIEDSAAEIPFSEKT